MRRSFDLSFYWFCFAIPPLLLNTEAVLTHPFSEATGNKHRLEVEIAVLNANYDSLGKLRDELKSELEAVKANLKELDEDYSKNKQSLSEI